MSRYACLIAAACLTAATARGQVLHLSEQHTGVVDIKAQPGDTLHLAVTADLGRFSATGLALFVKVPAAGFDIVDAGGPSAPFQPGTLFDDAVVIRNGVMSAADSPDMDPAWRLLEYGALLGPATDGGRSRTGSGLVACFKLYCRTVTSGEISLHSNPVHESRLLLEDGRTERGFLTAPPVHITVDRFTAVSPSAWGLVKLLSR